MANQIEVVKDYMGRGIIRQLNNSKSYFMRFRFNGHKGWTPWRTTGTSDLDKARRVASEHYDKLKEGLRDKDSKQDISKMYSSTSFMGLARKWLLNYKMLASDPSSKQSMAQYDTYMRLAERYMIEYFGGIRIADISTETIYDYMEWRRNYWVTGPGSNV
ncbi:MAG: hypothetical protein R3261_10500, partial [Alphaproteobacteria bacterium]|nr:hypothetical protein [Alphaproteobacteria bacterium]